jgi:hypothetical protein
MDSEHTIPAQSQSRSTLARVKDLLARLDSEYKSDQRQWSYTAEPCLTESELAAWETANGVSLPEAYRLFLLEIGNGGMMPGSYCDFEMSRLPSRVNALLQKPFPLSRERFDEVMARPTPERKGPPFPKYEPPFPELNGDWENDDRYPQGCLQVGRYPSYDAVYLIVSGEVHGTLWCTAGGNWVPETDRQSKPFDFLGWFEDVLSDPTMY